MEKKQGGPPVSQKNMWIELVAAIPTIVGSYSLPSLNRFFPELPKLESISQDSVWHQEGNVLTHTNMVIDVLLSLPEYVQLSPVNRIVLFLAALTHDFGKTTRTRVEEDGRITSRGHSRSSSIMARQALWRIGAPIELRERVCRLVSMHQIPFFSALSEDFEYIARKVEADVGLHDLCILAKADLFGRVCQHQNQTLEMIDLFKSESEALRLNDLQSLSVNESSRFKYFASKRPSDLFYSQPDGPVCTLVCGLPASGKDTYIQQHLSSIPTISFDASRHELGCRKSSDEGACIRDTLSKAKKLLAKKESFTWNATALTHETRDKIKSLILSYNGFLDMIHIESDPQTLEQRNSKRNSTIPYRKILSMANKWEVPVPSEARRIVLINNTPAIPKHKL